MQSYCHMYLCTHLLQNKPRAWSHSAASVPQQADCQRADDVSQLQLIRSLQDQLAQADSRKASMAAQIMQLESQIAKSDSRAASLAAELDDSQARLAVKQTQLLEVTQQLHAADVAGASCANSLQLTLQELEGVNQQLYEQRQHIKQQEQALLHLHAQVEQVQQQQGSGQQSLLLPAVRVESELVMGSCSSSLHMICRSEQSLVTISPKEPSASAAAFAHEPPLSRVLGFLCCSHSGRQACGQQTRRLQHRRCM